MFPNPYFGGRYFASRYFAKVGAVTSVTLALQEAAIFLSGVEQQLNFAGIIESATFMAGSAIEEIH